MIEFEEYKTKLGALKPTFETLSNALKLDEAREEIQTLEAEVEKLSK